MILASKKYNGGKRSLLIQPERILISERDEENNDRWIWLNKRIAIAMAKIILKTYKKEKT